MGTYKEANRRARRHIENLPKFTDNQLVRLCDILGAETSRRVSSGELKRYTADELQQSIRHTIARGTFADRLNQFADAADKFVARG